ncbi:MAG: hypothetical protein DI535_23330 [Citrobacter freundii]|nr:MAG: hypothetical protein DI535_23330 [Citrobacter freundii]
MAHNVTFTIPDRELGNADLEFKVKKDQAMFGTLKISRGAIVWVPKDHKHGFKMNWSKLSELLSEHGVKENG